MEVYRGGGCPWGGHIAGEGYSESLAGCEHNYVVEQVEIDVARIALPTNWDLIHAMDLVSCQGPWGSLAGDGQ